MAIELPILKQGFPNLIKDLGVILPQQGPFWTFTPMVSPVFIIGADAEVNANPPRFTNKQAVKESVSNPINGTLIAASPSLKRGRYVFWCIWMFGNLDAANGLELHFLSRDQFAQNQQFVFLDVMEAAPRRRSNARGEATFTMDLNDDQWNAQFVTVTTGTAPIGLDLHVQHMFHKYADLPNQDLSDLF